ncbi:MAG: rhomboid family intramembrane serine protease [Armatimonadota bacterium]
MLLPYRVKNPIKNTPYATYGLIATNFLVYLFTTHYLLYIDESVAERFSFTLGASPFYTFFTAAFLHADIFHILGNMLFLWLFGRAVEDRLGPWKFLGVYFATGLVGGVLQGGVDQVIAGHVSPVIGASGCIMGAVGAYWYIYPWSTVCVFYWFYWFWRGVWEVAATWIIGLYVLIDLLEGTLYGASGMGGGVANFAHIGGAVAGALLCIVMGVRRDTEGLSDAKAVHADAGDLTNVPFYALQTMIAEDPGNPEIIRAMMVRRPGEKEAINSAMAHAGPGVLETDPTLVGHYLTELGGDGSLYRSVQLLRLAGTLERIGYALMAARVYRLIADRPEPEAETSLYRAALCLWKELGDAEGAKSYLAELAQRFPSGEMIQFGRALARRIEGAQGDRSSR